MRRRIAIAATVALIALVGMIAIGASWLDHGTPGAARLPFASPSAAAAPFAAFDEARVAIAGTCERVLVAATLAKRNQGLRGVRDLGPYAGMLFVFPNDVNTMFTMAQTPTPIDITFYDANGSPVDTRQMKPCPDGTDATCPAYASKHAYRFALERFGSSGSGAIGSCAA